jgi:DNA-binding LacI/PurR family transcriptional regulator
VASLKSVAEHAGVPILTAYHALSNGSEVDPATAERVRAIAATLGYT